MNDIKIGTIVSIAFPGLVTGCLSFAVLTVIGLTPFMTMPLVVLITSLTCGYISYRTYKTHLNSIKDFYSQQDIKEEVK